MLDSEQIFNINKKNQSLDGLAIKIIKSVINYQY